MTLRLLKSSSSCFKFQLSHKDKHFSQEQEKAVINGAKSGYPIEVISAITGLTQEQITEILKRNGLI
jgi:hypothetical protein